MAFVRDDQRMISQFLDKSITPEEFSELEAKLIEDSEFADDLVRYTLTHRQIMEILAEDKLHLLLDDVKIGSPSFPRAAKAELFAQEHADAISTESVVRTTGKRSKINRIWIGLAATLVMGLGGVVWHSPVWDTTTSPQATVNAVKSKPAELSVAATVTRLADCQWPIDAVPLQIGDQLDAGTRIAVKSGLIKLSFECGAEVVLQGPCDFLLESPMLGFLTSGKVTANVPRRAFSFAIRAPGIDVVDLGTEFGLSVDGQGQAELHVFDGEVIYRQDAEGSKSSDVVHVVENRAVKFGSAAQKPSEIAVDEELFSQHFELRDRSDGNSSLPVQRDLALWLCADRGVDLDEHGRVMSWHDLVVGDNKVAEDAFQKLASDRPRLIADAINLMPAIRFDGQNDHMFTTQLETTDNQTVFLVCQFSPEAFSEDRIYGGQIINYDGPPNRELSNTHAPGVLQIGEPLLQEEFSPSLLTAQVFAGFIGKTTVEAGRVDATAVGPDTPVIIAYHYDYDNRMAKLIVNGQVREKANAFAPAGLTSRKVIGRHSWMELFFQGDLAEVLIFNNALTPEELESLNQYLAEKYTIQIGKAETSRHQ